MVSHFLLGFRISQVLIVLLLSIDRSVSEKALELAYRLMPPSTNKVDRKAWLLSLFPVDVFEDYKSPRDKFDKMKSVEYFTVSAILKEIPKY